MLSVHITYDLIYIQETPLKNSHKINSQNLTIGLENLTGFGGVTRTITMNKDKNPRKVVGVLRLKNG